MRYSREAWEQEGGAVAAKAFDAGVLAVLACVFGNTSIRDAGISGSIGEEHLARIRKLRKKVNGKKAYGEARDADR